jgi:hypothetical protein
MPLTRERIEELRELYRVEAERCRRSEVVPTATILGETFSELLDAAERDLDVRALDEFAVQEFRPVPNPVPDEECTEERRWRVIVIRLGVPRSFFAATHAAARRAAAEAVRKNGGG